MIKPQLRKSYHDVSVAFGFNSGGGDDEALNLVCSYVEALGFSRDLTGKHPAKWRVIAGCLDRRYQGAILKWWWIDRKHGAKPPFGLGTSEPLLWQAE